jgi:hypothetical protein
MKCSPFILVNTCFYRPMKVCRPRTSSSIHIFHLVDNNMHWPHKRAKIVYYENDTPFNLQIKTSYFQLISSLLKVNDIQLQASLNFITKSPVVMSLLVNLTGLPVNKQIRKDYTLQIPNTGFSELFYGNVI